MSCAAASQQGAIETFWLHFWELSCRPSLLTVYGYFYDLRWSKNNGKRKQFSPKSKNERAKSQICAVTEYKVWNRCYRGHTEHKHTFHRDVLDGEAQDDGPDHTKGHLHITVNNFCKTNKHVINRGNRINMKE